MRGNDYKGGLGQTKRLSAIFPVNCTLIREITVKLRAYPSDSPSKLYSHKGYLGQTKRLSATFPVNGALIREITVKPRGYPGVRKAATE